jgi:hypothetical protein
MFAFGGTGEQDLRGWFASCAKLSEKLQTKALAICEAEDVETVASLMATYQCGELASLFPSKGLRASIQLALDRAMKTCDGGGDGDTGGKQEDEEVADTDDYVDDYADPEDAAQPKLAQKTQSRVVMSLDQYPPSAFTHNQWSALRNTLYQLGKPFRGDPSHSNCSLYRIALAMNLCQQYYGELVSVVGHQGGRLIPERICTFILGPPEGKSNLVDRINELQNVPCSVVAGQSFAWRVVDDLHALRQYSNQADHDGTDDLQVPQKADIVDRVYRVVRAVLEWQQNGGGAGNGKGGKGKGGKGGEAGGKAGGKVGGKAGGGNLGGKGKGGKGGEAGGKAGSKVGGQAGGGNLGGKGGAGGGGAGGAYVDSDRALVHAGLAETVQQMQHDLADARARKDFAQCKDLQQRIQKAQKLDTQAEQLPQELDAAFARNDFAGCEALEPKIAAVNTEIDAIVATGNTPPTVPGYLHSHNIVLCLHPFARPHSSRASACTFTLFSRPQTLLAGQRKVRDLMIQGSEEGIALENTASLNEGQKGDLLNETEEVVVKAYIQRCQYSLNGKITNATTLHGMDSVEKQRGKRMNHDALCGFVAKT